MSANRKEWIARAAILFCALVIASVSVEGFFRLRSMWKFGSAEGKAIQLTRDSQSGLKIPVPRQQRGVIRTDSRGFRNPELEVPKPEGRIRLAFLGASTTFCAEVSSNEKSWPHLVREALSNEYPDLVFDYVNAGVPGYNVESSLVNLEKRVKELDPDVIVIYHATNDLSKDTRDQAYAQGAFQGQAVEPSWLARHSVAWYWIEKNLEVSLRQRRAATHPAAFAFDSRTLSAEFGLRLTQLIEASTKTAPVVAVATFSHKMRRDQSPELQLKNSNTSLYYMPYMTVDKLFEGFEAYNRAIEDVSSSTGVVLISGEYHVPGDDIYFSDSIHFKDAGSQLMAKRVFEALTSAESFLALVDRVRAKKPISHAVMRLSSVTERGNEPN